MSELAGLSDLSTEQLRERSFELARERRDIRFFWDLFRHLPHAEGEGPDGALGIEATIDEAVALWREATGHAYGDQEPLIRARFIDYLLRHRAGTVQ